MKFLRFREMVEAGGLSAKRRGLHWMIVGGEYRVNYYPTTGMAFVNGMAKGIRCGPEHALLLATIGPPDIGAHGKRKTSYRKHKLSLMQNTTVCHWCKCELTVDIATVDHRIPLGRGGANTQDNMVLACFTCNNKRGCSLGPPAP